MTLSYWLIASWVLSWLALYKAYTHKHKETIALRKHIASLQFQLLIKEKQLENK